MAIAEQTQETQTEEPAEDKLPEGQILHTLSDDDDDEEQQGVDPNILDKRGRRSYVRELKAQKDSVTAELEKVRNELAEVRGLASRPQPVYQQPPQQQQQQQDPVKMRLGEISRQKAAISRLLSDPKQQVDIEKLSSEYEELDNERVGLVARQSQPRQSQPQISYEETVMRAEFPEMFPDQGGRLDLYHEANAEYARLRGAGKAHGLATMKEAAGAVWKRHGIGQKAPPPTSSEKAKLSGTPGRAGASGQAGNQVALTKRDIGDALSYFNGATGKYAQWSDKQKVDYWVKNVKLKA